MIPCDVKWPGAECENLLLILTSKNHFQLDCVRKSLRRPRKTTVFIQELVQSLLLTVAEVSVWLAASCRVTDAVELMQLLLFLFCAVCCGTSGVEDMIIMGWEEKWLCCGGKVGVSGSCSLQTSLKNRNQSFFSLISFHLLAALAFQGRTWRAHLPDSLYGTVILMSHFSNHLYTKSFHEWLPYNFSTLIVNGYKIMLRFSICFIILNFY